MSRIIIQIRDSNSSFLVRENFEATELLSYSSLFSKWFSGGKTSQGALFDPVLPFLFIPNSLERDPLKVRESRVFESLLVGVGLPEVVVKTGLKVSAQNLDVERVSLLTEFRICRIFDIIFVGFGEVLSCLDQWIGVDSDKSASWFQDSKCTVSKSLNHFDIGGIIQEVSGSDHIKLLFKFLQKFSLTAVIDSVVDSCAFSVFLGLSEFDHLRRDVHSNNFPLGELTDFSGIVALPTGIVDDVFASQVIAKNFHESWSFRQSPEWKHLGLFVLNSNVSVLVFSLESGLHRILNLIYK
jgi:hypothetical protein